MFVKDTVLRAGQRIFNRSKIRRLHAPSFFYYPNWIGLFDDNWRIRYSSIKLLGDFLCKISGVSNKMR
jgi:hypothetical protein